MSRAEEKRKRTLEEMIMVHQSHDHRFHRYSHLLMGSTLGASQEGLLFRKIPSTG